MLTTIGTAYNHMTADLNNVGPAVRTILKPRVVMNNPSLSI